MAFSIRHDQIRFGIPSASQHALLVDQCSQTHQRLKSNAWLVLDRHTPTTGLVEHPARDQESQILLALHDDSGLFTGSQIANHLHFAPIERVKSVFDPSRAELMSSVSMPSATAAPPTCTRVAPTFDAAPRRCSHPPGCLRQSVSGRPHCGPRLTRPGTARPRPARDHPDLHPRRHPGPRGSPRPHPPPRPHRPRRRPVRPNPRRPRPGVDGSTGAPQRRRHPGTHPVPARELVRARFSFPSRRRGDRRRPCHVRGRPAPARPHHRRGGRRGPPGCGSGPRAGSPIRSRRRPAGPDGRQATPRAAPAPDGRIPPQTPALQRIALPAPRRPEDGCG